MKPSIKTTARIGGMLYLLIILFGLFGEMFVRGKLIVSGDATATASNIMAHELLWRVGIAGDLLMHVCDVGLVLIFYILLKPVNKNLALLAVLFNLIQTSVLVANKLNLMMPLFYTAKSGYLSAFDSDQLYALTYLSISLHGNGFGFGLIYFGVECLILGYLIMRSKYIPSVLGVGMQMAGVCYLINSFSLIIAPSLANILFPFILVPAFLGEFSMCLWLLIKGVNVQKWEAKAAESGVV